MAPSSRRARTDSPRTRLTSSPSTTMAPTTPSGRTNGTTPIEATDRRGSARPYTTASRDSSRASSHVSGVASRQLPPTAESSVITSPTRTGAFVEAACTTPFRVSASHRTRTACAAPVTSRALWQISAPSVSMERLFWKSVAAWRSASVVAFCRATSSPLSTSASMSARWSAWRGNHFFSSSRSTRMPLRCDTDSAPPPRAPIRGGIATEARHGMPPEASKFTLALSADHSTSGSHSSLRKETGPSAPSPLQAHGTSAPGSPAAWRHTTASSAPRVSRSMRR